jgi:hypothetical protein
MTFVITELGKTYSLLQYISCRFGYPPAILVVTSTLDLDSCSDLVNRGLKGKKVLQWNLITNPRGHYKFFTISEIHYNQLKFYITM